MFDCSSETSVLNPETETESSVDLIQSVKIQQEKWKCLIRQGTWL